MTTFVGSGAAWVHFWVPTSATVQAVTVVGSSPVAFIIGDGSVFFLQNGTDSFASPAADDTSTLAAGDAWAYFVSTSGRATAVTLTLGGLDGNVTIPMAGSGHGQIEELSLAGPVEVAPPVESLHWEGRYAFGRTGISVLAQHTRGTGSLAVDQEFRQAVQDGVFYCFAHDPIAIAGGYDSKEVAYSLTSPAGEVTLESMRTGFDVGGIAHPYGLWIERAPDDPTPASSVRVAPVLQPLLPETDAECARECVDVNYGVGNCFVYDRENPGMMFKESSSSPRTTSPCTYTSPGTRATLSCRGLVAPVPA